MANFVDLLAKVFDALGGVNGSTQWEAKDKRDNAMIESRIAQIQAVDKLRNWQDERYATRYVSPTVRNLEQYKKAGGNVADYARAQLAAINADPTFQAMTPERQRLVYDKFRQTFASELEVAKAAGDNATYMALTNALGLPSNNNYVQLQETSGDEATMRWAQQLRNPYIQDGANTAAELERGAANGARLGNVSALRRLNQEQGLSEERRQINYNNADNDRLYLERMRRQAEETAVAARAREMGEYIAGTELRDLKMDFAIQQIRKAMGLDPVTGQQIQQQPLAQPIAPQQSVPNWLGNLSSVQLGVGVLTPEELERRWLSGEFGTRQPRWVSKSNTTIPQPLQPQSQQPTQQQQTPAPTWGELQTQITRGTNIFGL